MMTLIAAVKETDRLLNTWLVLQMITALSKCLFIVVGRITEVTGSKVVGVVFVISQD